MSSLSMLKGANVTNMAALKGKKTEMKMKIDQKPPCTDDELRSYFERCDLNGNGYLDSKEVCACLLCTRACYQAANVAAVEAARPQGKHKIRAAAARQWSRATLLVGADLVGHSKPVFLLRHDHSLHACTRQELALLNDMVDEHFGGSDDDQPIKLSDLVHNNIIMPPPRLITLREVKVRVKTF